MLTLKPLAFFKPDPSQPRKHFTQSDLSSLGASMKALGQLQPVGAKPDGTLLWGERRYRAASRSSGSRNCPSSSPTAR